MLERLSKSMAGRLLPRTPQAPVVIAVAGPYGSTGKTTVAINLALELAAEKNRVLLIDGDTRGPSVANHFLLTDQPAGLGAALRISSQDRFDLEQLDRLSFQFQKSSLRIMPGSTGAISQPFGEEAVASLLEVARSGFDYTVIDLGQLTESEPDAIGQLTREVLNHSDKALFVALADPVGIFRLLHAESLLGSLTREPLLILNRVRNSVIAQARREISITLQRLGTLEPRAYLPDDPQTVDQALRTGVPSAPLSRSGIFRQALTGFVRVELLGQRGPLDSRVAKLG